MKGFEGCRVPGKQGGTSQTRHTLKGFWCRLKDYFAFICPHTFDAGVHGDFVPNARGPLLIPEIAKCDNLAKRCRECDRGSYWGFDFESVVAGELRCTECGSIVRRSEPLPQKLRVYTDGSFRAPWTTGGWAAVVYDWEGNFLYEYGGTEVVSSSGEIELWAALKVLEKIPEGTWLTIFSDCRYVVQILNERQTTGHYVLIARIRELLRRNRVDARWVRGHRGVTGNLRADRLAARMVKDALARDKSPRDESETVTPRVDSDPRLFDPIMVRTLFLKEKSEQPIQISATQGLNTVADEQSIAIQSG